jgi:hypothetical protein
VSAASLSRNLIRLGPAVVVELHLCEARRQRVHVSRRRRTLARLAGGGVDGLDEIVILGLARAVTTCPPQDVELSPNAANNARASMRRNTIPMSGFTGSCA